MNHSSPGSLDLNKGIIGFLKEITSTHSSPARRGTTERIFLGDTTDCL